MDVVDLHAFSSPFLPRTLVMVVLLVGRVICQTSPNGNIVPPGYTISPPVECNDCSLCPTTCPGVGISSPPPPPPPPPPAPKPSKSKCPPTTVVCCGYTPPPPATTLPYYNYSGSTTASFSGGGFGRLLPGISLLCFVLIL